VKTKSSMPAEAKARIGINDLLSKSGWRFFADTNGLANVQLEAHVKLTKKILDEFGNDFEKTAHGSGRSARNR
jgi:type I restriction enzyme, R subunit